MTTLARDVALANARALDDVVRRAQRGDVDAFETLYRAHAAAVLAVVRRMVADERVTRELVQDVFVRAWERLASFRGESALATWLHRLAVNRVLEHFRSARRDATRFLGGDEDGAGDAFDASLAVRSPERQLEARLDLDTAIARLPLGARTVFLLHDVEGYAHDEIAQLLGLAPGTVRAQLWRARRHLMRLLDA